MDKGNANILSSSFDRISGTATKPSNQPLNDFRIINEGGNLVQGQINRISLTEVSMQYDTPTIVYSRNNQFSIIIYSVSPTGVWEIDPDIPNGVADGQLLYDIPEGFYTGEELVTFLNDEAISFGSILPLSDFLTFTWDSIAQRIQVQPATVWSSETGGIVVELISDYSTNLFGETFPTGYRTDNLSYPNFFWTLGLRNLWANGSSTWPVGGTNTVLQPSIHPGGAMPSAFYPPNSYRRVTGTTYTGRYTDYVDIVSTSLCQNQYVRDSTTGQAIHKRDVIARIYVCNDSSMTVPDPDGCRPFNIHRQFNPPKIMKWTVERSVDALDLSLFDMYGLPMPVNSFFDDFGTNGFVCGGGNYGITLHVHEPQAEEQLSNNGYRM
jgi:hypothetical protein